MRRLLMLVLVPCLVIVGCATEDGGSTTTDPNAPPPPPAAFTMEGRWDASLWVAMSQVTGPQTPGTASFVCITGGSGIADHVTHGANEMVSGWNITLPNCGSIAASPEIVQGVRGRGLNSTGPGYVLVELNYRSLILRFDGQLQSNEAASFVSLFLLTDVGEVRFDPGKNERRYLVTGANLTLLRPEL